MPQADNLPESANGQSTADGMPWLIESSRKETGFSAAISSLLQRHLPFI
jgi:hypothetical protein